MPRLQKNVREFRCEIILTSLTMFIDRVLDQLQREKIPQQIKNSNKHILNINENIYINNAGNISDIIITYLITLNCSNLVSEKKGKTTSLFLRICHLQTPLLKKKIKQTFHKKSQKLVQDFKIAFNLTLKSIKVW